MRIKILMMFKDEGRLLKSWIKYHARLVGQDNLVLFDNGSTDRETIEAIDWANAHAISINRSYASQNDFVTRGDLFRDIINEKTYNYRAAFYMPIDCDEFLAVERDGRLQISRAALQSEIKRHRGVTRALAIHAGLDNDPSRPGRFIWSPSQQKRFFAAGNCFYLDHGYHCGLGMHGDEPVRTKIVYIHYHFKPYRLAQRSAMDKLAPYTTDFSKAALEDYIAQQRPAFHCAYHLLRSEEEYLDQYASIASAPFPEIDTAFRSLGESLPFDDRTDDHVAVPQNGYRVANALRAIRSRFKG